jgi:ribosome-associated translation inhibitor RaiA
MVGAVHHAPSRAAVRISITGRRGVITGELRNFARRRLSVTLRRFSTRLREVYVRVEDVNGPRRGVDQRCRIELRLKPRGRLTVAADATNVYAAVAQAAKRAATLLDRTYKRQWMARQRKRNRRTVA